MGITYEKNVELHVGRMWDYIWELGGITYGNKVGITYGKKVGLHMGIRGASIGGVRWVGLWE